MNEILDDFREKKKKDYGKRSFRRFLISFAFLLITIGLLALISLLRKPFDQGAIHLIFLFNLLAFILFATLGLISGIKSFSVKEPMSYMKWVGLLGNLLLFIFIIYFIYNTKEIIQSALS